MDPKPLSHLLAASALAALATSAAAQCTNVWLPGYGCPGVNGQVAAMTQWDPDGAGPAPALIVLAGSFSVAGPVATAGLAPPPESQPLL